MWWSSAIVLNLGIEKVSDIRLLQADMTQLYKIKWN